MRWFAALFILGISAANAAPRPLVRAFNRLDSDKDEFLSAFELLAVTRSFDGSFEDTTAVIHAWFDGDESGGIDLGEWQDGRGGDGNPVAPDLTGDASLELDVNKNGKVSRQEFWKVITRYVPAAVAGEWYPAQFPGGQVTGSSSTHGGWGNFDVTVVGPDTPPSGIAIGGSGTLTLGSGGVSTLSPGTSTGGMTVPGDLTLRQGSGASAWSSGVSAQWSSGSVAMSSTWLQSLPERDAMLPLAEGSLSFEFDRLRTLEFSSVRLILLTNRIVDLSNFSNFAGTDPAVIQVGPP